ncbi:kinetochore Sim4 complex subunit FTA2-domain-containing protein [Xylaria sp. FL1777]|nr:kinetochore Sim4 complex subunit FTA2-domain-containing protein [Xylaria sp. FL1777]
MTRGQGDSGHISKGPLPPGGGPNIREFKNPHAPIEWIKRLDDPDREYNDAFVYQVRIASQEYALKVFKFSTPKSSPFYWGTRLQNELPLKKAIFYTDPFYAECRAYGRIEDGKVNRHSRSPRVRHQIAVKCYGYLLLDERDKRWLLDQGHDLETDLLDNDVREALEGDTRVRAIVKHLDMRPSLLHAGNIRRAWKSVQLLNESLKIYNMDIKADNFIGFRLVDFGSSWTEPHELLQYLDKISKDTARSKRGRDTQNFDDMIEEEEIPTRLRVAPMSRHQLRSRGEAPWAGRELPKRRRTITRHD